MGVEGRNLDPHNISAEAALAQPCPGAPSAAGTCTQGCLCMWRQFQVQSVLPQLFLALKDSSAAGLEVGQ